MFEVRILCRRLPKSINDVDDKIISFDQSSISTNNSRKNLQQLIREYKRQSLAKTLEKFELQIEENESFYQ